DDYGTWLRAGKALHREFDGSAIGLKIWHQWSSRSAKYDEAQVNRIWRNFCAYLDNKLEVATPDPSGRFGNTVPVDVLPGYESLFLELRGALDQAQKGKGAERHNVSGQLPFDKQRMQQISRMIESPDGMVYQVCKKVVEGVNLPTLERQVKELHGAIVYLAGIAIFLRTKAADQVADEFHRDRDFRKFHTGGACGE
ncbi:MAG: PriCT-2 domain-containing protein, partial [Novosphingobium sp.]